MNHENEVKVKLVYTSQLDMYTFNTVIPYTKYSIPIAYSIRKIDQNMK